MHETNASVNKYRTCSPKLMGHRPRHASPTLTDIFRSRQNPYSFGWLGHQIKNMAIIDVPTLYMQSVFHETNFEPTSIHQET